MKHLRRWLWLLLLVPFAVGLAHLRFDVEILNLLPPDSPIVQGLKLYQEHFSNARELIITVKSANAETSERAARSLALQLRMATNVVRGVVWQAPWIESPIQASEIAAFVWLNQPPQLFGDFTNRLASSNLTNILTEAKDQLASSLSPNEIAFRGYDPYALMRLPESVSGGMSAVGSGMELFSSPDGAFRLVFVEAVTNLVTYRDCIRWIRSVKEVVARAAQQESFSSDLKINYTGRPAFVAEIAGAMEKDLAGPSVGTVAVIALLFYVSHRRWRPLVWLLVLLALILGLTLAAGGLWFGTLNVVSLGFASILLGLAEDFGIVLYQESRSHPELSLQQIRHEAQAGIIWSAITTSGAFFLLNLSGLPGLGQLGSLVGIGILIAAVVMLFGFLPPLLPKARLQSVDARTRSAHPAVDAESIAHPAAAPKPADRRIVFVSIAALCGLGLVLCIFPPVFDHSAEALRPRNSPAYAAVEEIKNALGRGEEPLWVLIPGRTEAEVLDRLKIAERDLDRAASNGLISHFTLPTSLWPDPKNQAVNRETAKLLLPRRAALRAAALDFGFSSNALVLTDSVFDTWTAAATQPSIFWPTNPVSRWIVNKVVARDDQGLLALGLLYPGTGGTTERALDRSQKSIETLNASLKRDGIILSGWTVLSSSMFQMVQREFPRVLLPIIVLVVISLWLAYRNLKEVLLSVATLVFSGLSLFAIMRWCGWSWNLMNLMALPLLLGMGVDFSIHIQLALRRYRGDTTAVRSSIGRALLLAGSTTVAGFGSLMFSSNAGMVSLGLVCATGIICAMLVAIYLLPSWWSAVFGRSSTISRPDIAP